MRYIIISLIAFSGLFASQKVALTWWDEFDSGFDDYAQDVAVDSSENVYVTGYFKNGSNYDGLTIKYNCPAMIPIKGYSCGEIGWIDTIDSGSDDYPTSITIGKRGYIYIAGYYYNVRDSNYTPFIVKYDTLGRVLWTRIYNYSEDAKYFDITVDTSGNIYTTGYLYDGNYDYLTVKHDSEGNIIWVDTSQIGDAQAICVDKDQNVYVTGYSDYGTTGMADIITIKYDTSGHIIWADTFDDSLGESDVAFGIAIGPDGSIYVTGGAMVSTLEMDYFTIKYTPWGDTVWTRSVDNGASDISYDVAGEDRGNVFVTGQSKINSISDCFTIEYDTSGNVVWSDTFSVGTDFYTKGIAIDNKEGVVYITGYFKDGSNYDYYTFEYALYGGIAVNRKENKDFLNVRTISTKDVNVEYNREDESEYNIDVYGIDGRRIRRIKGHNKGLYKTKIKGLAPGIYLIRLSDAKGVITRKVVLIR